MTKEELTDLIAQKRKLHYECVGWLYKSILADEIIKLSKQLREME